MKRMIIFICATMIVLSMSMTALAGSIPEDLLHSDDAQIFFAEVINVYQPIGDKPYIEVLPVKAIKGDVRVGDERAVVYVNPNIVGNFKVKKGRVYLFAYFDENNPTDIFEVASYDTSTLRLKNIEGDMWKRFERYLNEGDYLEAEQKRLDKQNESLPIAGENISLAELIGVAREEAEEVSIHYQSEIYRIDVNSFYNAIDGVLLTDIEDVSIETKDGDTFTLPNGMYITVNGLDGYAFITDDCKVDQYAMHHSTIPNGEYTIKSSDRKKILSLLDDKFYESSKPVTPFSRIALYCVLLVIAVFTLAFSIGCGIKKKKKPSTADESR